MSFNDKSIEIPATIPLLPIRDVVVFPYMVLPFYLGREASIRAVEEALSKNRLIFIASQKEITEENPTPEGIYQVGTVAKIMRMKKEHQEETKRQMDLEIRMTDEEKKLYNNEILNAANDYCYC